MHKQEKEMIVTPMSNVNAANKYTCNKNSTPNSQYINNTVKQNADSAQLKLLELYSSRH